MRLLLTLLVLLVPAIAQAQFVQVHQRFGCNRGKCFVGTGSGVVIGWEPTKEGCRKYYVLTSAHNAGVFFKTQYNPGQNYGMFVPTRAGLNPAKIEQCSGRDYLMLLSFVETAGEVIGVAPIANRIPDAGEPVTIHGFPNDRQCQYGARQLQLRSVASDIYTITTSFKQGESGGPILDKNGEIQGICEGWDANGIYFGPSVIAIRRFLNLPAIGSRMQSSGGTGQLPMRPGVQVQGPGDPEQSPGTDAPKYEPPVYKPRQVVPAPLPVDEPRKQEPSEQRTELPPTNPKTPQASDPPIPPIPKAGVPEGDSKPKQASTGDSGADTNSTVGSKVVTAAKFGLDLWSVLAGVGLVAGTGGVGAVALWGWRGLKAARALKQMRQGWGGPSTTTPSPVSQQVRDVINTLPTQAPVTQVTAPAQPTQQPIRLPLQSANFVEIPVDYRRESVDYALAETGRKYPGAIATLEVVKSLINQHLQANGHGPESLHS